MIYLQFSSAFCDILDQIYSGSSDIQHHATYYN